VHVSILITTEIVLSECALRDEDAPERARTRELRLRATNRNRCGAARDFSEILGGALLRARKVVKHFVRNRRR
jgi:hypothetical protein